MSAISSRVRFLPFHPLVEPPACNAQGMPIRRLNLNESPFPPAETVIAAMAAAISGANRYPDGEATALIEALATATGAPEERIFVGAGSNELLAASSEITLDPGDAMVAPVPAFPTYSKLAAIRGAEFIGVPVLEDGAIDVDATLAAVTPRTRLLFVSSPHNPTGSLMSEGQIRRLAIELPDHVMLHFDEAYYEFGRAAGGPETLPILEERRGPWLSTRTFSKAYGLAGARVGYGIGGSAEIAEAIRKVRPNFSLGVVALAAGRAALDANGHSAELVDFILSERRRMAEALAPLGFASLPGAANFLALLPPDPAAQIVSRCAEEGVYIGSFDLDTGKHALRVTIGSREDNDAFIALMAQFRAP